MQSLVYTSYDMLTYKNWDFYRKKRKNLWKSDHSNVQSLINDLKELKSADTAVGNADETDLLAMMDSV